MKKKVPESDCMKTEKRAINVEWQEERFLERWWKTYTSKGKAEIYQIITGKSVEEAIQGKYIGNGKHYTSLE